MLVEPLMLMLQIGGVDIHGEVLGPLVNLMKWCPAKIIEIAQAVLHRLGNGSHTNMDEYHALSAALPLAAEAVKGCPEQANEIVAVLVRIAKGLDSHHSGLALRALSELITIDLERIDLVVDTLISACSSSYKNVKVHAVGQISGAIKACPDKSTKIIDAILKCCGMKTEM